MLVTTIKVLQDNFINSETTNFWNLLKMYWKLNKKILNHKINQNKNETKNIFSVFNNKLFRKSFSFLYINTNIINH